MIHTDPLPHPPSVLPTQPAIDSLDIKKSVLTFPDQCRQVITDLGSVHIPPHCYNVKNIVVTGMGGSALGGRIVAGMERQVIKIPIINSTEYHLPNFVNEHTLVIPISYSGNTEETLSALAEARSRGSQLFIIASGGKLAQIAQQFDIPNYIFKPLHNPSHQPRMGLGYSTLSILLVLSRCQLIHHTTDLGLLPQFLRSRQSNFPQIIELATDLKGKIPVFLASEHLKGAVHAVRNQLHENAKTFAVYFDLPEANHHLLEGLRFPDSLTSHLTFILVRSPTYHPEITRRFDLTAQVLKKQGFPIHHYPISGQSSLFEIFDVLQSGAYLAYAISQLNAVDPGPISWVDWFKDNLNS